MTKRKKIAFYVHIPFCPSGCRFCHFYIKGKKKNGYIDLIKKEFNIRFGDSKIEVDCIHIGGGTPNLLSNEELKDLLNFLRQKLSGYREFSIELHPALCTTDQLDILKAGGINRISFGIQSMDENILKHHTRVDINYEKLGDIVLHARKIGIKKINFDFIYDLIGDSNENIKRNFEFISQYKPSSVYYYRLRKFTEHLKKHHVSNEKRAFGYYLQVKNYFKGHGYLRLNNAVYYDESQLNGEPAFLYDEIIYASNHNLIGIGVAATSEVDNYFTKNTGLYDVYKESLEKKGDLIYDEEFYIDQTPQVLNRFYFYLLQKSSGRVSDFVYTFGNSNKIIPCIKTLEGLGLLQYDGRDEFKVTEKGHYYFDEKIGDIIFMDYRDEFELLKKL